MTDKCRHIAIVTTTRADWGLLSPLARELYTCKDVALSIIAGNMHFDRKRGYTIDEIIADGFIPAAEIAVVSEREDNLTKAHLMAQTMATAADTLARLHPHMVVLLGDRYEMLAYASAAATLHIPIAHISGGEITVGAIDDSYRHAISKLSSLHFATTEEHRQRLIRMGEHPSTVFNVGALGARNAKDAKLMSRQELELSLGFDLGEHPVLVTFHQATNDKANPVGQFRNLLSALDAFPQLSPLFTYPNNDGFGSDIIGLITQYVEHHPNAHAVPSLGRDRYLSALQFMDAVIGNSSSGLVEVPSAGIPTVDIGMRQQGRTAGPSVIHCDTDVNSIVRAIQKSLSSEMKQVAALRDNPYFKPDTPCTIAKILVGTNLDTLLPKQFYDLQ